MGVTLWLAGRLRLRTGRYLIGCLMWDIYRGRNWGIHKGCTLGADIWVFHRGEL